MKQYRIGRIALLMLALWAATACFALADAPQVWAAGDEEIEILTDGEGDFPGDGGLILEGEGLLIDDGFDGALELDGLPDLQLAQDALIQSADGDATSLTVGFSGVDDGILFSLEGNTQGATVSGGMDNDALFQAWMAQRLPGLGDRRANASARSGRASLRGVNRDLYDALKPMIEAVAQGRATSTQFKITRDDVDMGDWYTAEELGLTGFDDSGVGEALLTRAGFKLSGILPALLADFPYDLYWFDKTSHGKDRPSGLSWSYSMQVKTEGGADWIQITSMTARMVVARDYSRDGDICTYEVNADLPLRVQTAASNIRSIVSGNAGGGDLERLRAYADEICRLVKYDSDAASDADMPYGDPWQLVSVFDGDDSTGVVCEGYSKSFKYLCDLSDFDGGVACELMSGTISVDGGDAIHMWNALRMPDGCCYLVDLTNSDAGSACNWQYFLKGCANRTGASFTCGAIRYTYAQNALATFSEAWLAMSERDYGEDFAAEGFIGEYDGMAHGIRVTPGNASDVVTYGTQKDVYGDSSSPAWRDAGTYTVYYRIETGASGAIEGEARVTIAPRTVGLDWTGTAFSYDGSLHAPVATATGLVSGDACAVTVDGVQRNAGSYTARAVALSNGNYALPPAAKQAFTIEPKPVGVSWTDTDFTYDGSLHAPAATATGLVSGDVCAVTVQGGQRDAGSYTARAVALSNGNYALPSAATQAFTIAPRPVGLKWTGTELTYNGKAQKPDAAATGLLVGDVCTVTVTGEGKNAGSYTARAVALSNDNYALPAAAKQAFTIGKKTVGLKWSGTSLIYNGKLQSPGATATGLIRGDECTVTVKGGRKNAGSYTARAAKLSNGNYALPQARTQAFTIGKKTVGLKWSGTSLIYNGKLQSPGATATGLVKGDECTVTVKGGRKNAGSYTARAAKLSNGNYALPEAATQAFTIGKKTVGLKWSGTSLIYNGKLQSPGATATGLVKGDKCTVTVKGGRKNAGSYTARAAKLSNGNYALPSAATQAFTIGKKTVGLKWSGTSLTYNGKLQSPGATATGLIKGDECTVTVKGGRKNAGSYTARAVKLSNGNYALPRARTKVCTIGKRTVRLKWTRTRLKYNGKSQKPTATAAGLVRGDTCEVTVSGARKKRGTYTATATRLSNRNYRLPAAATVEFRIY